MHELQQLKLKSEASVGVRYNNSYSLGNGTVGATCNTFTSGLKQQVEKKQIEGEHYNCDTTGFDIISNSPHIPTICLWAKFYLQLHLYSIAELIMNAQVTAEISKAS